MRDAIKLPISANLAFSSSRAFLSLSSLFLSSSTFFSLAETSLSLLLKSSNLLSRSFSLLRTSLYTLFNSINNPLNFVISETSTDVLSTPLSIFELRSLTLLFIVSRVVTALVRLCCILLDNPCNWPSRSLTFSSALSKESMSFLLVSLN